MSLLLFIQCKFGSSFDNPVERVKKKLFLIYFLISQTMTLMVTLTIRRRIWKSIKASVHFICLVWFISFCNKNIVSGCDRRRDRRRMAGLYEMKCFLLTIHLVQMDKACVMRYRRLCYTPTRWSIWMFLSFEITHKIHFDSFSGQSNFFR